MEVELQKLADEPGLVLHVHHYPPGVSKWNKIEQAPGIPVEIAQPFGLQAIGDHVSDNAMAPGAEIGRLGDTYRRVRIESAFGKITVLVTDGHLPYPYGHETTGYDVTAVGETLAKAKASGANILVEPYKADEREAAIVEFPGGYIAEIHSSVK